MIVVVVIVVVIAVIKAIHAMALILLSCLRWWHHTVQYLPLILSL